MPGLVPGIHVLIHFDASKAWMAGTSPAMTTLFKPGRFVSLCDTKLLTLVSSDDTLSDDPEFQGREDRDRVWRRMPERLSESNSQSRPPEAQNGRCGREAERSPHSAE